MCDVDGHDQTYLMSVTEDVEDARKDALGEVSSHEEPGHNEPHEGLRVQR